MFTISRPAAAIAIVSCLALSGCKDKVTMENFDAVQTGMTMQQVEEILGKGERQEITGTSISGAGVAGTSRSSQDTYLWKSGAKEITVTFENDKVVNKNRAGI